MSCPTQAWVNANDSLFILKGSGQEFVSPFTVKSDDLSNSLLFTVDNNIPFSKATLQYVENGVTGATLALDADAVFIKFTTLDSAAVFTQSFTELLNQLYITDSSNTLAYLTIDANSAVGGSIVYSDPNSSILFSPQGNVLINTYVAVEQSGLTLTVLDGSNRSAQITSHDILFSDASQDPIGTLYVNGTGLSMTCTGFPFYPGITLDTDNIFTINSGLQVISQSNAQFSGVESTLAFAGASANPNYYLVNSTVNAGSNGRFANQLNFMSPYNGTTYNFFQLDAINKQTTFTQKLLVVCDLTKPNTGEIQFVGGGDGNFGGRILTQASTNGLYISANNYGTSSLGDLYLFGSTIQLGTVGSPANVTINGQPISVFPPVALGQDSPGAVGDFYGIPYFPGIDAAFNIAVLDLTTGLNSLNSFCVTIVANGWNNNGSGITTGMGWRNSDVASLYRFVPPAYLNSGASGCLTSTKRFYLGRDYTSTTASLSFQLSAYSGDPRFVGVQSLISVT